MAPRKSMFKNATESRTTLSPFPLSTYLATTSHSFTASSYTQSLTHSSSSYQSQHPSSSATFLPATSSSAVSRNSFAPHKLSAAIITLLAVGSAFLILGIFIVFRACTRPARRTRPKPSLPILNDSFDDDLYKVRESPLFGGAERFSSQTGLDNSLCTPASKPELGSAAPPPVPPLPSAALDGNNSTDQLHSAIGNGTPEAYLRPPPSQSMPVLDSTVPFGNPLQQIQPARTLPNRLSTRSFSLYPTSPVASNERTYTADGHRALNRNSKLSLRKSHSRLADDSSRLSILTKSSSVDIAYDGVDVTSPKFLAQFQEVPPTPAGRSKIKSTYYTPGSYPRMSSIPSSTSSKIRADDVNYPAFDLEQLPPIHRGDGDNRALTSALDLMSPPMETVPLSPQPTLTPDDSMSIVESKKTHKRPLKKPAPSSPYPEFDAMSSTMDTCTALGNLMLADYSATSKSLSSRLAESSNDLVPKGKIQLHNDRPPRVPSPPSLPSLAQMGLENTDPVAYASYRSPTYSIFGMYETDRKSRMSCNVPITG